MLGNVARPDSSGKATQAAGYTWLVFGPIYLDNTAPQLESVESKEGEDFVKERNISVKIKDEYQINSENSYVKFSWKTSKTARWHK